MPRPLLALFVFLLPSWLLTWGGCSDYLLSDNEGDGNEGDDDSTPPSDDDATSPPDDDTSPDEGQLISQECSTEEGGIGTFDPQVEWHWPHLAENISYSQVIATPIITHLTDDNEDGVYNELDMPTIVVPVCTQGISLDLGGGLIALRGDGTPLWWHNDDDDVNAYTPVAAGDLDGDGDIELVVGLTGKRLGIIDHEGNLTRTSAALGSTFPWCPVPALADLDGDGTPEIVAGKNVLNADLSERWDGPAFTSEGGNGWVAISAVADVNMDGSPDVLAGNRAYDNDGFQLWESDAPDGFSAVGDFDLDGDPEIVLVSNGTVWLVNGEDGAVIWGPRNIDGTGGAPTIADVDGDGYPEIGVAGMVWFWCLETDGTLKWKSAQQDTSSAATGSSVFDFEGDGNAELIYGDELRVRIFDGSTGEVRYEIENPNGTAWENPTIADVDQDGNAEMVIVASTWISGTTTGVRVIGDLNDSWVPTRSIWNQHTYHITNIMEDGTIPAHEDNSWEVHNTYRLNALGDGGVSTIPLPDLVVMDIDGDPAGCPDEVSVEVQVGNQGEASVEAGVAVSLYAGSQVDSERYISTAYTTTPLDPMDWEWVGFLLSVKALQGESNVTAIVDEDGAGVRWVTECNEKNNTWTEGAGWCE